MKPFIYVLIAVGFVLQAFFIAVEHKEHYVGACLLKGLAALMFVLIAYNAYSGNGSDVNRIFLTGMVFGMIGDILLALRYVFEAQGQKIFLAGIASFLVGHILYLLALIRLGKGLSLLVYGLIGVLLAGVLLAYIFKTMEVKKAFKIFGVFYLGAVFVMMMIAVGIAVQDPSLRSVIYCLGAILFTASDVVLIFNTFSGVSRFSLRVCNLSLYYLGQILIACSLFF